MSCAMGNSEDHLLGGRVCIKQPREGYRAGLDAVLLAASVPAQAHDQVLDLGTGAGAVALCLLARIAGSVVTGIERDPVMAALAAQNGELNGWGARFSVINASINRRGLLAGQGFDHVMANPPFHDPHRHRMPRLEQRAQSLVEGEVGLAEWFAFALKRLKPGGSLTFILRADRLAQALAGLEGVAGRIVVLPIHSRANEPAIRIIVQAIKGRRTPLALLPPLILLDGKEQQSARTRAILHDSRALLDEP